MNLTREQIEAMPAGREMDTLIAYEVMGAQTQILVRDWQYMERREDRPWEHMPYYSTEMGPAWEVVDRMRKLEAEDKLNAFWFNFWHSFQGSRLYELTATEAATAICKAALVAVQPKESLPVEFDKLSKFFENADFSHLQED